MSDRSIDQIIVIIKGDNDALPRLGTLARAQQIDFRTSAPGRLGLAHQHRLELVFHLFAKGVEPFPLEDLHQEAPALREVFLGKIKRKLRKIHRPCLVTAGDTRYVGCDVGHYKVHLTTTQNFFEPFDELLVVEIALHELDTR